MITAPLGTQRGGQSQGRTCDDETVRIVSPALPGHVRVASPSGRPQLDDGAKCAVTHAVDNKLRMKIIPDGRGGGGWPLGQVVVTSALWGGSVRPSRRPVRWLAARTG